MIHQIHCPRCQRLQQVDDTRVVPCVQCGLMLAAAGPVPVAQVVERGNYYGQPLPAPKSQRWMIWAIAGAVLFFVVVVGGSIVFSVYTAVNRQQSRATAVRTGGLSATPQTPGTGRQGAMTRQQMQDQIDQINRDAQQRQAEADERLRQARERIEAQRRATGSPTVPSPQLKAAIEKSKNLDLSEYDKHWSVAGKVSDNLVGEMTTGLDADGVATLADGRRIRSRRFYQPPATFRIVAQTAGNNFRLRYAADQIIFNWDGNRDELRIEGGPAAGRHKPGAGAIPLNQWVAIELQVTKTEMIIRVDGEERFREPADFSKVNQSLNIWTTLGSPAKVKSVQYVQPDNTALEK